jgi:disulfide bond formation protein DsbB
MTTPVDPMAPVPPPPAGRTAATLWLRAAFLVALAGLLASLFLSLRIPLRLGEQEWILGMNLKACPLCFYQRTFMMSLVGVLFVGRLSGLGRSGKLGLVALPLAVAGLGVAGFHVYLEAIGRLECPKGLADLGTVPQQSLAVFALLFVLLLLDALVGWQAGTGLGLLGGLVVGGLLSAGSCIANPPMPAPPAKPYPESPEICRPPYRPQ